MTNLFAGIGDNEQRIKVPVESVVVYLDGAEITHNKTVTLESWRYSLFFSFFSFLFLSLFFHFFSFS